MRLAKAQFDKVKINAGSLHLLGNVPVFWGVLKLFTCRKANIVQYTEDKVTKTSVSNYVSNQYLSNMCW